MPCYQMVNKIHPFSLSKPLDKLYKVCYSGSREMKQQHRHKWIRAKLIRETYHCVCGMMKQRRLLFWILAKRGKIIKRIPIPKEKGNESWRGR